MTDLEKNIETPEDTGWTNPAVWNDFNLDFSDVIPQEEPVSPIFSDTSSDNWQDSLQNQEENIQIADLSAADSINWKFEEVPVSTQIPVNDDQLKENLNTGSLEGKTSQVEFDNTNSPSTESNEVFLWNFDNEQNNVINQEYSQPNMETNIDVNTPVLEWFKTPERTGESEEALQNHEKQKLAQKEKLIQMIMTHETKAQKKWFTLGILSGIILTVWIAALCFVFAKDQIVNFINNSNTSSTVVVDENIQEEIIDDSDLQDDESTINNEVEEPEILDEETLDNDISDENLINIDVTNLSDEAVGYYNQVNDILNGWLDTQTTVEQLNSVLDKVMQLNDESNSELVQYISQSIMDMTVNYMDDINNQDYEDLDNSNIFNHSAADDISNSDDISDSDNITNSDSASNTDIDSNPDSTSTLDNVSNSDNQLYKITHVDNEKDANWVLPNHCSDLTCYGEDKEFIPCKRFRMDPNLDDKAQRIWNSWACKYKDASELVYVEFN